MASEPLNVIYTAGLVVYWSVWDTSALVFDFNDNTFKLMSAPPTTPYLATTEKTDEGGVGASAYIASLNLSLINSTGAIKRVQVAAYQRLGGSPAPLTDTLINQSELSIQGGVITTSPGADNVTLKISAAVTSSAGTEVRCVVYGVLASGAQIVLTGAATLDIREAGAGSDLLNLTDAAPNAAGEFEFTQASPGFTSDRLYRFIATVTETDGTVHAATEYLSVMG